MFLVVLLGGCSDSKVALHVYIWADYIKPELIQRFEKERKFRVVVDTFDSNEAMYAKLRAGATGYDVVFPSSYMARVMWDQGMLQALVKESLPNIAHLDLEYLKVSIDQSVKYSVPYMMTISGIGFLRSRVSDFAPTWAMFDRPDLADRMTLLNDMRETMGAALKFLGCSLNSRDERELEAARDVVIRWKKNTATFENEQYKTGLGGGEFLLVHGYSGDILQVRRENRDVDFAVPLEGASLACDDMVILSDSRNPALAHAFINFLHEPAVAAENTEFTGYLCPNQASYAYLTEETRKNPALFPSKDVRDRLEVIVDLGNENAKYVRIWDEIKAASAK